MLSKFTEKDILKKPIPPIVYKIVVLIIIVLVAYLVWKMYSHLPPERPFQYPA
jgi:hypothetical protein